MKVSFIIPSVDRITELQNCILSVERAYDRKKEANINIEIIVVFNGVRRMASSLNMQYPLFTYVFYIDEKNVSKARNFGIMKSSGEYLIFIDDDAAISENFLDVLYDNILNKKEVNAFYARILDPLNKDPFTHIYEVAEAKYLSYFDYLYSGGTSLVLARSVLDEIGLYNEQFGPGGKYPAAEESDLFFRMIQAKKKILYLPELVILHPVIADSSSNKVYNYSYAIGAMLTKQIFYNPSKALLYSLIILTVAVKSGIRSLQNVLLPETIKEKNKRFKYASVLNGTLKGVVDYIRDQNHTEKFT